ncbi:hypothetical protein [Pseudomonas sp. Q2-TVG4-2]|uniref:hypothetical protein n=1 Tax=Pseudomonas sp. Q2-TVG4-2 TaxID=1685699 RepID=UPI0015E68615|nr:hypothetical protein [Pseudomonas sp. Q2-TVG4-2]
MNVQWNSQKSFQVASQGSPTGSPGTANRGQTGRIRAVSELTTLRQTRQRQPGGAQLKTAQTRSSQIDKGLAGTHFGTAIDLAVSRAAAIDHQAVPQYSGSERVIRPEGSFSAGKRSLTARGT